MATYLELAFFAVLGLYVSYTGFWGRHRRLFRSLEYTYKHLAVSSLSDQEFAQHPTFRSSTIPPDKAIEYRHFLADALDYPPDRLHPEMLFNEIPLEWSLDRELDDLMYFVEDHGGKWESFLENRTVGEIVIAMWDLENSEGSTI